MSVSDVVGDPGRTFEERPGLSRRQLVRAGVWAAPVIVLTTAVPAVASSDLGYLTMTFERLAFKDGVNNNLAELDYTVRRSSRVQNDGTGGDVFTFTVTGLTAPFTGSISEGGITWGPVSPSGTVTGTRSVTDMRGQPTQGTIRLPVSPGTTRQGINGKITVMVYSRNANGQGSSTASLSA